MTISLEEHVARAIWRQHSGGVMWENILHPATKAKYLQDARAAIAAVREREGAAMMITDAEWPVTIDGRTWSKPIVGVAQPAPDPAEAMRAECEAIARQEEVRNPSNNGTQSARRIKRAIAALKGNDSQ